MNIPLLTRCNDEAFAGTMTFGETIKHLLTEGIEWYSANLILGVKTYYTPDGTHHQVSWPDWEIPPIDQKFQPEKIQAALEAIQQQKIIYPEFLLRIAAAGTTYYTVHLQGRKALYFGRHGDFYIEPFPKM